MLLQLPLKCFPYFSLIACQYVHAPEALIELRAMSFVVVEGGDDLLQHAESQVETLPIRRVLLDSARSDEFGEVEIRAVLQAKEQEVEVLQREVGKCELALHFALPKALLHDEQLVDLLRDQRVDPPVILVFAVHGEDFEPAADLVVPAGDIFSPDDECGFNPDEGHLLRKHYRLLSLLRCAASTTPSSSSTSTPTNSA